MSAQPLQIKRRVIRGSSLAMASQVVGVGLQIVTIVVLARLLSPSDYGLQSMVTAFTGFLSLFRDAGLGVAAVQRDEVSQQQMSTLFWVNVLVGVVLTAILIVLGPAVARFYGEPRLAGIMYLSASVFLLYSVGIQHRAILDRSMRFGTGAMIETMSNIVGTLVAIVLALRGFGYWALILQTVSLYLVGAVGAWAATGWMPSFPRWSKGTGSMLRFGSTVTLNSVIIYIGYNMEKVLLGRFTGAYWLGAYGRAYQLINLPVQQINNTIGTVVFPSLSRLQDDRPRLNRAYLRAQSVVVSMTVPCVFLCALLRHDIIIVLLSAKWLVAEPLLLYLCPAVLMFALMSPLSWLLRSTGRVKRSFHIAVMIAPTMIAGVALGLRYGVTGVACGYSISVAAICIPAIAWSLHDTGITLWDYVKHVYQPIAASVCGWVAVLALSHYLSVAAAPVALFAARLLCFVLVYIACLWSIGDMRTLHFEVFREVRGS